MDYSKYMVAIASLVFVLSLIGIVSFLIRRYSGNYISPVKTKVEKRMKLIEILPLDAGRKVILLQKDNVEHVILLAGNNAGGNLHIEKNIVNENLNTEVK